MAVEGDERIAELERRVVELDRLLLDLSYRLSTLHHLVVSRRSEPDRTGGS